MYKISVPIMNDSVTRYSGKEYLRQMKEAGVHRVFVAVLGYHTLTRPLAEFAAELKENCDYFEKNGIESAVWVGETIGHGGPATLPADKREGEVQHLVSLTGQGVQNTRCPYDADFRKSVADYVAGIARVGIKTILLDDDFRLSHHGNSFPEAIACVCPLHMARISELCGETLTVEELKQRAFESKANKYRRAFIAAQGESLRLLASDIRAAVDAVDPDVRIGLCSGNTSWDIDGATAVELARILAGKNRMLIRVCGAPYWPYRSTKRMLPTVFEYERVYSSFCASEDIELMAEGDTYPRPRFNVPSSYLELFDAMIRADGRQDGILKYMFDYSASPEYETGYLDRHVYNIPIMKQIEDIFYGKRECGVGVPSRPHLLDDADLELGTSTHVYPYPLAGSMMATLSIPTVHVGDGMCCAVFGEEARHISEERLEKGAILDGLAAVLLTQRGIDVGLRGEPVFRDGVATFIVRRADYERSRVCDGDMRYLNSEISDRAEVVLDTVPESPVPGLVYMSEDGQTHCRIPTVYRYENANGQKFVVFMADTMALPRNSGLYKGYLMQNVMMESVEWISSQKLPAVCKGNPDLYVLCKKSNTGLSVGLFNCYADSILKPVIKLDREYRSIRFVGCGGKLCGDTVYLNAPIPAFEFAAFEVKQ